MDRLLNQFRWSQKQKFQNQLKKQQSTTKSLPVQVTTLKVEEKAKRQAVTTAKPTAVVTTVKPTTVKPTTVKPTTVKPTTVKPTTVKPTTVKLTTVATTVAIAEAEDDVTDELDNDEQEQTVYDFSDIKPLADEDTTDGDDGDDGHDSEEESYENDDN
jgi:hypothetical protein